MKLAKLITNNVGGGEYLSVWQRLVRRKLSLCR
jgi:hypothetical protein